MNYHLASELTTILFNTESQTAKLNAFLAENKQELIELNIYDKINNGIKLLNIATSEIDEIFLNKP